MVAPRFGKVVGGDPKPAKQPQRAVKDKRVSATKLAAASSVLATELAHLISYEVRAGLGVAFDVKLLEASKKSLAEALFVYGDTIAERSKEG